MFYLREVFVDEARNRQVEDGTQINTVLGPTYSTFWAGSPEFREAFTETYGDGIVNEPGEGYVRGFIISHTYQDKIPLRPGSHYYIMTESGKTFQSL